jgi:lipid A ethanolaminephosphotransferase
MPYAKKLNATSAGVPWCPSTAARGLPEATHLMRLMFTRALQRPALPSWLLIVVSSLWLAILGNVPLWKTLYNLPEVQGWRGFAVGVGFALMIAGITSSLLAFFNWRGFSKVSISLLLLLAAFATHYMLMYNVVVDTPMLINVLQTDAHEASDQLSWRLFATVVLLALAPMLWLWRQPIQRATWQRQVVTNVVLFAASLVLSFASLQLVFQDFASLMRNHIDMRYQINPLNSIYAVLDYTIIPSDRPQGPLQEIGLDSRIQSTSDRPPLLVFVLGETARSQNFGLNGYQRDTTPRLAQENITSFTQVRSCGTSTAESLPCMFSHLTRNEFNARSHEHENFLDVLQRAGYGVVWIDNQSGCKGQCDRIPNLSTASLHQPEFCSDDECRDSVMLTQIHQAINKVSKEKQKNGLVIVMHQMGSHGPAYYKRTDAPFKKFLPECKDTALSLCERSTVINAYDNTIVQTDFFLAQVITWLKTQEKTHTTAMLYVADHGESLGENNLYLHGLPYSVAPAEQTTVPLITWLSPSFENFRKVKTSCLKGQRHQPLSHDNLFHSVLGLMAVQTQIYKKERDLFAACEGH